MQPFTRCRHFTCSPFAQWFYPNGHNDGVLWQHGFSACSLCINRGKVSKIKSEFKSKRTATCRKVTTSEIQSKLLRNYSLPQDLNCPDSGFFEVILGESTTSLTSLDSAGQAARRGSWGRGRLREQLKWSADQLEVSARIPYIVSQIRAGLALRQSVAAESRLHECQLPRA